MVIGLDDRGVLIRRLLAAMVVLGLVVLLLVLSDGRGSGHGQKGAGDNDLKEEDGWKGCWLMIECELRTLSVTYEFVHFEEWICELIPLL